MENRIKISYFLHTTIGEDNGIYYIKDLLNEYFIGVSTMANVTIVGTYESKKYFHSSRISDTIKTKFLDSKKNKNIILKVLNSVSAILESEYCFLFMPCMSSVIAGFICTFLRKPFVTYFGANWYDLEISRFSSNRLKAYLFKSMSNYLCSKSMFSLHTGKSIQDSHAGNNKYITAPILNYSNDSFYKRPEYKNLTEAANINILYVGSLTLNKGIDILLRAIHNISHLKLIMHIVGDGIERRNLELLTRELGINNTVVFYGFIENGPNLYTFYRNCDIFILPSFSEGFPRVLYEAASNGCCIITTDVNSIPDILTNKHDCLFVKPGDQKAIERAINMLLEENGLNATLANNAYKTIEPYLKEKAYEQHIRLIQDHLA